MIFEPLHLTATEITAAHISAFSIRFEAADHKNYWQINVLVEAGQAFLVNESQKLVRFYSELDATAFCYMYWPSTKRID